MSPRRILSIEEVGGDYHADNTNVFSQDGEEAVHIGTLASKISRLKLSG
jgi:hypothetical protein